MLMGFWFLHKAGRAFRIEARWAHICLIMILFLLYTGKKSIIISIWKQVFSSIIFKGLLIPNSLFWHSSKKASLIQTCLIESLKHVFLISNPFFFYLFYIIFFSCFLSSQYCLKKKLHLGFKTRSFDPEKKKYLHQTQIICLVF